MMDALLESKILDLFEKTKGDFNAHGMGFHVEMFPY